MATMKVLILVLFVVASAASYSPSSKCDFSGLDLDGGVEYILSTFPRNFTLSEETFRPIFKGLEVGAVIAAGMNRIKRYGALKPFCVGSQRFLEVDFINNAEVAFYVPWRTCSGNEGKLMMHAEFSRFTVIFRVDRGGFAEKFVLRYEGDTVPVNTHNVHLIIEGAGRVGRIFSGILSRVLSSYATELWNDEFFSVFRTFVRKALE